MLNVAEDDFCAPRWATDIDADLPVSYEYNGNTHRFILGDNQGRAVCLSDSHPATINPEELITLAAGCWQTLVRETCDRSMAELIAKGWILAAKRARQ